MAELTNIRKKRLMVDGQIRFLYLGRLEREKGIEILCQAFCQVSQTHPHIFLDVAGSGALERNLRSKYEGHSQIRFWGLLDGQEKMDTLRAASVVVVPSLVEEVFGLTAIEAFAFGKPVIASRIGGLPELVRQGETGWLARPGDIEALAEQIREVASLNETTSDQMSRTCEVFAEQFAMEKILALYVALYRELLKPS